MIVYCQQCGEGFKGDLRHKYCEACKESGCRYCDRILTPTSAKGVTCNACATKRLKYNLSDKEMLDIKDKETCECCGEVFKTHREKSQDHCHTTGDNRGVICVRCNWSIGMFETTEQNNIIKYLTKYRK